MKRLWLLMAAALTATVGMVATPAAADEPFDVYTTPGTHQYNGRTWHTACEDYSSSVERCRTEIRATTVEYTGGRFVERTGWAFNNLTYKASPRAQWAGNILAIPGEHTKDGRRWKTECDSPWTGTGACRSMIWTDTFHRKGAGYVRVPTWVFNNIVHFRREAPTAQFCTPKPGASGIDLTSVEPAPEPLAVASVPSGEAPAAVEPEAEVELASEPSPTAEVGQPTPKSTGVEESAEPAAQEPAVPETGVPETAVPETAEAEEPLSTPTAATDAQVISPAQSDPLAASAPTISAVRQADSADDKLYNRLGDLRVSGTAAGGAGYWLRIEMHNSSGELLARRDGATGARGSYQFTLPGGFTGKATLTVINAAGTAKRAIELLPASLGQTISPTLDPVAATPITGKLVPAVGDALVSVQVQTSSGWQPVGYTRTAADGSYKLPYSHGSGRLGSAKVQLCATLPSGATVPSAGSVTLTRARLANPRVTVTTATEVAGTYSAGCPVGPSGLRTIRINQESMDGRIYRGEIIVRSDRADDIVDVFSRTFNAGFPVHQMTNPNEFGGDDPRMMAANNTSGFNCRRVVGNPYAMSPHAYGYAVDINPWQNPYRDPTGKWWPSTEHVSRTPVARGQLTESSAPVVAMRSHGWKWFSGWDWHHFEKPR